MIDVFLIMMIVLLIVIIMESYVFATMDMLWTNIESVKNKTYVHHLWIKINMVNVNVDKDILRSGMEFVVNAHKRLFGLMINVFIHVELMNSLIQKEKNVNVKMDLDIQAMVVLFVVMAFSS